MLKAIYYDTADINRIIAVYDPPGNHDASWPGTTKTTTATGSFTSGVPIRHHKIVADAITEMTQGEKDNRALLKDWLYKTQIDVTASDTLTDFQVRLEFDSAALVSVGKMEADGKDIRITNADGVTIIPHHVERGINTPTTSLYFKANLVSGANVFFLHHGNPNAVSVDDPENVFDFYDGFDGSSIDTAKWTVIDGTGFSVAGGELLGTDTTGRLRSIASRERRLPPAATPGGGGCGGGWIVGKGPW